MPRVREMLAYSPAVDTEPSGQVIHGGFSRVGRHQLINLGRTELPRRLEYLSVMCASLRLVRPPLRHVQEPPNLSGRVCKGLNYAHQVERVQPPGRRREQIRDHVVHGRLGKPPPGSGNRALGDIEGDRLVSSQATCSAPTTTARLQSPRAPAAHIAISGFGSPPRPRDDRVLPSRPPRTAVRTRLSGHRRRAPPQP
jgi:hypothetical protein